DKHSIENEGTFFRSRLTATQKSKQPASIALKYSVIVRDFLDQYIEFPSLQDREVYEDMNNLEEIDLSIRDTMNLGVTLIDDIIEVVELMGFTVINKDLHKIKDYAYLSMTYIDIKFHIIIIMIYYDS